MRRAILTLLVTLLLVGSLAHLGSPDIFFEGEAGPYRVVATIRTPTAIPGTAVLELRTSPAAARVRVAPVFISGTESSIAPAAEEMSQSPSDQNFFTGGFWLMRAGSWKAKILIDGASGQGEVDIPVPAFARQMQPMQKGLSLLLLGLMLFLGFGVIAIVGAVVRESHLPPAFKADLAERRKARQAMALAALAVMVALAIGNAWWNLLARKQAAEMLYQPPTLSASLQNGHRLVLQIGSSRWHEHQKGRWSDRIISNHGHSMHLMLLRIPGMDRAYHLHPEQMADNRFAQELPSMGAGHYQIFADVVRESGFPETMVGELDVPKISGKSLDQDDTESACPPISQTNTEDDSFHLPDGNLMLWRSKPEKVRAGQLTWFRFEVHSPSGHTIELEPYMGMMGHVFFVKDDRSVFAHVHPAGSIPMASVVPASSQMNPGEVPLPEHGMHGTDALPVVSFPYGLPLPGRYRFFVQLKSRGKIETGVFDIDVAR